MDNKRLKRYTDSIAANIKEGSLSQRELAEKLGMSISTISALAQSNSDPKLSTLIELSDALNMSLIDLIRYYENTPIDNEHEQSLMEEYKDTMLDNYRMKHSLSALYSNLIGISKCGQYNEDTEKVIKYVQGNISLILKGKVLAEEVDPLQE